MNVISGNSFKMDEIRRYFNLPLYTRSFVIRGAPDKALEIDITYMPVPEEVGTHNVQQSIPE